MPMSDRLESKSDLSCIVYIWLSVYFPTGVVYRIQNQCVFTALDHRLFQFHCIFPINLQYKCVHGRCLEDYLHICGKAFHLKHTD